MSACTFGLNHCGTGSLVFNSSFFKLLLPMLNIGIAYSLVGINGSLFERLIITDTQRSIVYHLISTDPQRGVPGLNIGNGIQIIFTDEIYRIPGTGGPRYGPNNVETVPDAINSERLSQVHVFFW